MTMSCMQCNLTHLLLSVLHGASHLAFTRADVQLFIVVACPAALLGHGARAAGGVAGEDAAAAVGDPNVREATEDEAAEAVVADAPAAREGGLLLDEGHRALRHGAQLRRAPLVTLLRRLHPIVHPHRVEHALALHVVAQGCDAPLRLLTVAHRVLQPPHLLVVRHVRVEARAVARQRPRDLAVARLPRPDVPPVVRGGGQREGLEAVPLGEEREDRLVVAVLLEARVLPRLG